MIYSGVKNTFVHWFALVQPHLEILFACLFAPIRKQVQQQVERAAVAVAIAPLRTEGLWIQTGMRSPCTLARLSYDM